MGEADLSVSNLKKLLSSLPLSNFTNSPPLCSLLPLAPPDLSPTLLLQLMDFNRCTHSASGISRSKKKDPMNIADPIVPVPREVRQGK